MYKYKSLEKTMNIIIPCNSLKNHLNWNIMLIENYSSEYFKINYSDNCCILDNVYVQIPQIKTTEEFQAFKKLFDDFKMSIFNRCSASLDRNRYEFKTSSILDENNMPKIIKINNINLNDNVICLNYDNIY